MLPADVRLERSHATVEARALGTYRILFEIIDKSIHLTWQEIEIEVTAEGVVDAAAKARAIARLNYGQRAEAVRITYFSPAAPG
jgi:hypothetical protein